jgi:KipI family sensor histidine kinase inhibitor
MEMSFPTFHPSGDAALLVTFGDRIDLATNRLAHALAARLSQAPLPGLGEAVAGYTTLLVHYDPLALDYEQVQAWVQARVGEASAAGTASSPEPRRIEVPVIYGGERGPDLEFVARHNGLSPEEVVRRHTARDYPVYLVGFTPGFPYLGGLDETIAAPRLPSPRSRVPAGSVGIAGQQTGIYSVDSPGGWRLIGWTPLALFDPGREPPSLLAPGDVVRFVERKK